MAFITIGEDQSKGVALPLSYFFLDSRSNIYDI